MNDVVDLATKVLAALAALLGLAGYVLVLGATILWFRLDQAGLPHEVPISIAQREELIAIGAQAVAIWLLLVVVLGGLAAWIVNGDPERRRFGLGEASLAITITVSAVLALDSSAPGLVALPCFVVLVVAGGAWFMWPSTETVVAAILPAVVGLGLAFALAAVHGNGFAQAAGATFIFGALLLVAPTLQRWRARQEANRAAIDQIGVRAQVLGAGAGEDDPVAEALARGGAAGRSGAVLWIRRIALGLVSLLILGVVTVASQVERDENFHEALVGLANGDCVVGTYIVRGSDQIVLARPSLAEGSEVNKERDPQPRITAIPTKEVLELQVYGKPEEGVELARDIGCLDSSILVRPKQGGDKKAPSDEDTSEG